MVQAQTRICPRERDIKFSEIFKYKFMATSNSNKVKLAILVNGDLKAPFSIATTLWCRGGHNSIPWIAPL